MSQWSQIVLVTLIYLLGAETGLRGAPGNPGIPELPGWKLTFHDEFSSNRLDLAKWNVADPWGKERNREMQAYVTNAFELRDGILRIKAEKRSAFYSGKQRPYTSGIITTYQKFAQKYGRFEIRFRAPAGQGMWPAFWLLPEPLDWPPEIDVFEVLGHEPTRIYLTHHWKGAQGERQSDHKPWPGPDFSKDFHTVAIEWQADRILWFVDGVERFCSVKHTPQKPMYLLANLAVGGDWSGLPNARTPFPGFFEIDYIRVYQKDNSKMTSTGATRPASSP
jgi:beta-glucanase (GH16 family)